MSRWI